MEKVLARNWWTLALRGALAILFGFLAYALGGASPTTLVRVFGLFAAAVGSLDVAASLGAKRPEDRPWALLFEGGVALGFALVALLAPWTSLPGVMRLIAAWIGIVALLDGASSLRFRQHLATPRLMLSAAFVSAAVAVALGFAPLGGEIVGVWLLGAWAAFFGVVSLAIGVVLRRDVPVRGTFA